MRMLLAFLCFFSFSCTIHPPKLKAESTPIASSSVITAAKIERLKYATARFEWHDARGSKVAHGTAFCIARDEKEQISLWMTCKHVAEVDIQVINCVPILHYKNKTGIDIFCKVRGVVLSEKYDVAIFTADFAPDFSLQIASEKELENQKLADILIASGCPQDIYPPSVIVGYYIGLTDDGSVHINLGAWYGNSGSAVVDLDTMNVIGVIHMFNCLPPESDNLKAVSAVQIREFLKEALTK